jgi:voltage-gated potassium channel
MTEMHPMMPTLGRPGWKLGILVLLRTTLSVSALFAAYFLIPTRSPEEGSDLPWLILELGVFAVIVAIQVPAIVKAKYPILRAVESMAVVIPLYLLIFARIYLSSSLTDPSGFSQPLNDVGALYFTVTVFSSVGFGDIVAKTNNLRLLVTLQMVLNLVVFGAVIRLVASAARRGVARRGEESAVNETPTSPD